MARTFRSKTLAIGDFVDHIVQGTGVILTLSTPPFALHWVELWDGRGTPPTAARNGFLAASKTLTPVPRPVRLIRRKRA